MTVGHTDSDIENYSDIRTCIEDGPVCRVVELKVQHFLHQSFLLFDITQLRDGLQDEACDSKYVHTYVQVCA